MERQPWDIYFIDVAMKIATRATCDRKHVGCVLVHDTRILCTGYNGSIAGEDHCDDVGHLMEDGHCIRTVHAEQNALCQAAQYGVSLKGATCYCTALPCWLCFKMLCNAGIKRIVFWEAYRSGDHFTRVTEVCGRRGIDLVWLQGDKNTLV